jgi:hypothetical protein
MFLTVKNLTHDSYSGQKPLIALHLMIRKRFVFPLFKSVMKCKPAVCMLLFCMLSMEVFSQYAVGDFGSTLSGNWNNSAIWSTWNGASWVAVPAGGVAGVNYPDRTKNTHILSGRTVTLPSTGPWNCLKLNVEPTGKIYTNSSGSNIYLYIYGDIICDGTIGNGTTFDAISIGIEGTSCSVTGSGTFDASRLRKNTNLNVTTNLTISRDINLRFATGTQTQIYNNSPGTIFNVTVAAGATLTLTTNGSVYGNAAMDGVSGTDVTTCAGSYTISGTMIVSGTSYLITNNTGAGNGVSWTITSGGLLRTAQVSTTYLTINCSITAGSTTVTTATTTGITIGTAVSGLGIPSGSTVSSIVNSTTYTISLAATATLASSSISFGNGTAGHMLRVMTGGTLEITGSPGFNTALFTSNSTYDIQNGSFTEFSAAGAQNVPIIPVSTSNYGASSNAYGYLKMSGTGLKLMFNSGIHRIVNDLNIVNSAGTPVLDCNNQPIVLGGHWYNYSQTGFTEGSGTVTVNGSSTQTINCPGGEAYYKLVYGKLLSSTLQFNTPVTVTNQLSWTSNGPVYLNGNKLTMLSAAVTAISNAGNPLRYIISEFTNNSSTVQWNIGTTILLSNYVIPFGKPGGPDYIPFTYSVAAGTTVGNLSVATYGTPANNLPWPVTPVLVTNLSSTLGLLPDNRDATVDRFWEVDVTAATAPSATVTFTYASSELPLSPYNNPFLLQAQWYDGVTDQWMPAISGQSSFAYYAVVPGLNTYGPWTLTAIDAPLPVELLSFTGAKENKSVKLEWITETEINNDYFTVERSANGFTFLPISVINGHGTSSQRHVYTYVDEKPLEGISYYRLRQTDFNGEQTISQVIVISFKNDLPELILYPQPAKDFLNILTAANNSIVSIRIFDAEGQLVKEFRPENSAITGLDISSLSPGLYVLNVTNNNDQEENLRLLKE